MPASPPDHAPDSSAKGRRGYGNTPVIFVIGLIVALVFTVGWGFALMNYTGTPGVQFQTIAWRALSENEASVTFEVSGNEPTECVVLAKDERHVEVGQAEVTVTPGDRNVTATVETVREATTVEVASCREQGSAK